MQFWELKKKKLVRVERKKEEEERRKEKGERREERKAVSGLKKEKLVALKCPEMTFQSGYVFGFYVVVGTKTWKLTRSELLFRSRKKKVRPKWYFSSYGFCKKKNNYIGFNFFLIRGNFMYIPQKFEYYVYIPPKSKITYLSFKIIQPHIFILQNPKP